MSKLISGKSPMGALSAVSGQRKAASDSSETAPEPKSPVLGGIGYPVREKPEAPGEGRTNVFTRVRSLMRPTEAPSMTESESRAGVSDETAPPPGRSSTMGAGGAMMEREQQARGLIKAKQRRAAASAILG